MDFFLPSDMPEDLRNHLQQQHDQMMMMNEAFQHTVAGFFDSLDKEQLKGFKTIIHTVVSNAPEKGRAIPCYLEGIATAMLHTKHHVCLGCDQDHDDLIKSEMSAGVQSVSNPYAPSRPAPDLIVGNEGMLSDSQISNMRDYDLDDVRDESNGILLGFVCMGCGTRYTSIEDRMLREPGVKGCEGCQNKEKWG